MRWQTYGDQGILLTQLQPAERAGLIAQLRQALPPACREFVIGYDSLLLVGQPSALEPVACQLVERQRGRAVDASDTAPLKPTGAPIRNIPVSYVGPDLVAVAAQCGLAVAEVICLHSEAIYTVHMMGFSPGFPYLEGLDPRLHLPRRDSPRNQIRPGSVAIGGPHAGIYSVASPGGWHLLGHTELPLFNPQAAQTDPLDPLRIASIFTLKPGDRVRFRAS
ncbi:MAG: allophanate hydrolase subunit 1 [Puniceicoccaceae bacterium]|nr:MAG: allophanate hydrolase subunit 1 [Puniceicoccaceae bacterium]